MARVSGDVLIERPVEEVFDFVADQRNEPIYNPRMLQSEKITDGPIGVGTRFRATARSGRQAAVMLIQVTGDLATFALRLSRDHGTRSVSGFRNERGHFSSLGSWRWSCLTDPHQEEGIKVEIKLLAKAFRAAG